jgi:hypothetical protein
MMIVGSYFKPLFKGRPFRLILWPLVPSLVFQYCLFLQKLFIEILEPLSIEQLIDFFGAHLRVTSKLILTSRSVPSLPRTGCSGRLFCTIYGP